MVSTAATGAQQGAGPEGAGEPRLRARPRSARTAFANRRVVAWLAACYALACPGVLPPFAHALPQQLAPPGATDARTPRYRVLLRAMTTQRDRYNDIDRWIIDIARADGRPDELDERDFIRGMSDEAVAGFLTAARTYVYRRWAAGDRSEDAASELLDAISKLALPPRYTVLMVYGNSDISGMRHGHLVGAVGYTRALGASTLGGFALRWDVDVHSLGGESLWAWRADPYVDHRLLLYLGIAMEGMRGEGTLSTEDGDALVPIDMFGVRLGINAHLRLAVRPWLTLQAAVGGGFGVGTLRTRGSAQEQLQLADPCNLDLTQIASADDAVRCTISNALGFYDTFPVTARLGAQLFGWLQVDGVFAWEPIYTSDAQVAPPSMRHFGVRLGVNIY